MGAPSTVEQAAQRSGGFSDPGDNQSQAGPGSGQHEVTVAVLVCCKGVALDDH